MSEMRSRLPYQDYTVMVVSLTYNHAHYIEDTLKGILMQQVDFPIVACVLDDCSTDGTADIVRKYEAQYPDIIKGFYFEENQFSQGKFTLEVLIPWLSKVKYIALCEGDDYWTDPLKLQKQVDYMESHQDCTLCFHNAMIIQGKESTTKRLNYPMDTRQYFPHEFFDHWLITTASIMFRSNVFENPESMAHMWNKKFVQLDVVLWLVCASLGKVIGLNDVMSVHRLLDTGYTMQFLNNSNHLCELNYKFCEHNKTLIFVFGNQFGDKFIQSIKKIFFAYNRRGQALSLSNLDITYWWKFVRQSFRESLTQTFLSTYYVPKILVSCLIRKRSDSFSKS